MKRPVEIHFHGMSHSDALAEHIRERAGRLDHRHNNIIGCKVRVERPHRHHQSGSGWKVGVQLTVPPRHELAVSKASDADEAHDNLYKVVDEAFEAAERKLRRLAERQRGRVKARQSPEVEEPVLEET